MNRSLNRVEREEFVQTCRKIGESEQRDPLDVAYDYWNHAITCALNLRKAKDEHDKLCAGENRL